MVEAFPRERVIYTAPYLPITNILEVSSLVFIPLPAVCLAGLYNCPTNEVEPFFREFISFPLLFLPNLLFICKSNSLWNTKDNTETSRTR